MRALHLLIPILGLSACADGVTDDDPLPTDTAETGDCHDREGCDTADTAPPGGSSLVDLVNPAQLPTACDDDQLGALLNGGTALVDGASCSFVTSAAATHDETTALLWQMSLPEGEARQVGETFQTTWDPTAGIAENEVNGSFRIQQGSHLLEVVCNDAIENEPVVQDTWIPIDGFMTLEVVTAESGDGTEAPFTGTLSLRGVVLQKEGSEDTCTVPDMDLADQSWGWLPG